MKLLKTRIMDCEHAWRPQGGIGRLRLHGVSLVEYAVLVALIAAVLVVAIAALRGGIGQTFDRMTKTVITP